MKLSRHRYDDQFPELGVLILSSPATEEPGQISCPTRVFSEKDPWSLGWESQSVVARLPDTGDIFRSPTDFSKQSDAGTRAYLRGLLNRGYSDRIELHLKSGSEPINDEKFFYYMFHFTYGLFCSGVIHRS